MKISIIIPCYNSEKYLERCIESIINQSYRQWEAIIVNDGSIDKSSRLLNSYAKLDKRITVISQKNGGPSLARNNGLKYVTGEYVLFIDMDDYIHVDMLKEMVKCAEKNNSDIVTIGYYETTINKMLPVNDFLNENNDDIRMFFIKKVMLSSGGVVWGKLYRYKLLKEKNILFDEKLRICEDQIFNLDFVKYSNNISFFNGYYYYYCLDNIESLTKKNDIDNIKTQISIQKLIKVKLNNLNIEESLRDSLLGNRLYIHLYNYIEYNLSINKVALNGIRELINNSDIRLPLSKIKGGSIYNKIIRTCIVNKKFLILIIIIKSKIILKKIKINRR